MAKAELKKNENELLEDREYWWWAEKKRSPRIKYLRKAVWSKATKGSSYLPGVQVDLENARLQTNVFKDYLDCPSSAQREANWRKPETGKEHSISTCITIFIMKNILVKLLLLLLSRYSLPWIQPWRN